MLKSLFFSYKLTIGCSLGYKSVKEKITIAGWQNKQIWFSLQDPIVF